MASQTFDRFYANAAMDVPGSLASSLQPALFEALRDFMQYTNVWTTDLSVSLNTSDDEYTLTPPDGSALLRLLNFYDTADTSRQWVRPATLELPNTLVLPAPPAASASARATVSLFIIDPVDDEKNPVFPGWILSTYFDVLYQGMLWRLYAQPGKPWSNPDSAKVYYELYVKSREPIRADLERRSNTFNNQNWTRTPELQRFYTNGMAEVPAATQAALQPVLYDALRDFFQTTNVWTTELSVSLTTSDVEYTLDPPDGTAIKRLMNFYKASDVARQWVRPATLDLPSTLVLARPPATTEAAVAMVSLYAITPVDADGAFVYPTWVIDDYFDTLYQGMLWRLYAQLGKPWSSPELAAAYNDLYEKGRDAARAEVERRANVFNNQNWTRVSAFQRFYTNGLVDVPGSTQPILQPALFNVLSDFMQHTNVWVETIDVPLVSGTRDYTLVIPSGSAIKRLMNLYEENSINKLWSLPATMVLPGTLRLAREPGEAEGTYVAEVSLFPVEPVDIDGDPTFPSWIIDQYFDTLYSGMLWRVYAQPGRPWSNAGLAATHYRIYVQGRGKALGEVQHGGIFNGQNWTFPAAGVVSRQRGM